MTQNKTFEENVAIVKEALKWIEFGKDYKLNDTVASQALSSIVETANEMERALEKSKRLYSIGMNESTHYHLNDEVLMKKCCDEATEIFKVIIQALTKFHGGKE